MDYYHVDSKICALDRKYWDRWSYYARHVYFNFRLSEIFYKPTTTTKSTPSTTPSTTPQPNEYTTMTTPYPTPDWDEYYASLDYYYTEDHTEEWHQPVGFEVHFRCVDDPWHETTTPYPTTEPTTEPTTAPNYISGLYQEYLTN